MGECYHGGASFDAVGSDFSRLENKNHIVRADVTDAWYDAAPSVINSINKDLSWLLRNSPPTISDGLIKTISQVRGIPTENLLVGGGSSDLMYLFFPQFMGRNVAILDPMYGEYSYLLNVLGKNVRHIKQSKETQFEISISDIVDNISNEDMLVIVNPNNPTGQYLKKADMEKLLLELPDITLFVDETYIDYVGKEESVETLVTKYKNLVVLKSMSKVYALSGARVGYLAAHKEVIERLRSYNPPWSVGLIGQLAGVEALKNEDYYRKRIKETHYLRETFQEAVRQIHGVTVFPSVGNFFLVEIANSGKSAQEICEQLVKRNIYVRNPDSQGVQFYGDFIRTAVKDEQTNQRIYSALTEVLNDSK